MAAQTEGIRKLMEAEKLAKETVEKAKRKKTLRLKEAKEEAKKEVEKYKREREVQFEEQIKKNAGSKDDFAAKMDVDTKAKLNQISRDVANNKEQVIRRLLEMIYDIKPEVHQNYKQ